MIAHKRLENKIMCRRMNGRAGSSRFFMVSKLRSYRLRGREAPGEGSGEPLVPGHQSFRNFITTTSPRPWNFFISLSKKGKVLRSTPADHLSPHIGLPIAGGPVLRGRAHSCGIIFNYDRLYLVTGQRKLSPCKPVRVKVEHKKKEKE